MPRKPQPTIAYLDQVVHWVKDKFAFNAMATTPNRIKYADGRPFDPFRSPEESLECCKTIIALIDELKPEKPIEDGLLYQMSFIIGIARLRVEEEIGDVRGWQALLRWDDDRAILKRFSGKLTVETYDKVKAEADFFEKTVSKMQPGTSLNSLVASIKRNYPDPNPSSYWQLQIDRLKRYHQLTGHEAAHLFIDQYKRLLIATKAIESAGVPLGLDFGKGV